MRTPSSTTCDSARSRDEQEEAVAEALIRRRVEDLAKAIRAKNIDGVMSVYAPNIVSFDIDPPLRYAGADRTRRAWQEVFAVYSDGPIAYEVRDLDVTTQGELAFVHSLNPRERHTGWRSHLRPVGALDSVLPANRWSLADYARPRVSPSRPRAWPGCSESHTVRELLEPIRSARNGVASGTILIASTAALAFS